MRHTFGLKQLTTPTPSPGPAYFAIPGSSRRSNRVNGGVHQFWMQAAARDHCYGSLSPSIGGRRDCPGDYAFKYWVWGSAGDAAGRLQSAGPIVAGSTVAVARTNRTSEVVLAEYDMARQSRGVIVRVMIMARWVSDHTQPRGEGGRST